MISLDQVVEKYPFLNRKWLIAKANKGLIKCSRPHYKLYLFNEVQLEKDLMSFGFKTDSDLDTEVAVEFIKKRSKK